MKTVRNRKTVKALPVDPITMISVHQELSRGAGAFGAETHTENSSVCGSFTAVP